MNLIEFTFYLGILPWTDGGSSGSTTALRSQSENPGFSLWTLVCEGEQRNNGKFSVWFGFKSASDSHCHTSVFTQILWKLSTTLQYTLRVDWQLQLHTPLWHSHGVRAKTQRMKCFSWRAPPHAPPPPHTHLKRLFYTQQSVVIKTEPKVPPGELK